MSIKNLVEMIKHNGLLTSMAQLEKLYRIAIENEEKLAESEDRCAALTAENAGLKESRKNLAEFIHEELDADYPLNMDVETPATDAFLAEVRAHGVEMFSGDEKKLSESHMQDGNLDTAIQIASSSRRASEFADELRKGVQS